MKVIGLPKEIQHSGNRRLKEQQEVTLHKVVELSRAINANLDMKRSIAHRLPSRGNGERPIVVKFSQRSAKINLFEKKRG